MPPLVDFSVLITLRGSSVPGSDLQMSAQPPASLENGATAASAMCQGIPYGETCCGCM